MIKNLINHKTQLEEQKDKLSLSGMSQKKRREPDEPDINMDGTGFSASSFMNSNNARIPARTLRKRGKEDGPTISDPAQPGVKRWQPEIILTLTDDEIEADFMEINKVRDDHPNRKLNRKVIANLS